MAIFRRIFAKTIFAKILANRKISHPASRCEIKGYTEQNRFLRVK